MVNGRKILYVKLKKALYGTLRAALLFWQNLTEKLKKWGFVLNAYDTCVANKMINGKQCTILWHVDDIKVSHVDPKVVSSILELLNKAYGGVAPLVVTRGKKHDYLGMTLDFSVDGKVGIDMTQYLDKMLIDLPTDMEGEQVTPAGNHLFEVSDDPVFLDENQAQVFHFYVAKLLFLCKRARPDIQTPIAFLTTRVQKSDQDDWKKLGRVMKYLNGTRKLVLTLEADDTQILKWWIDGSYATHHDMRSHTGGMLSLGKGAAYASSIKQKLNTKSSTEAELVAVNDVLPQVLWTRYFLEAQGYKIQDSVVYQDNLSAMLLEKNGKGSSSKRTRHINIRYFFVKDRVQSGELSIQHCPTGIMIADFFTKPLQGTAFRKFRDEIMNIQ
jgi:hypothetical protein